MIYVWLESVELAINRVAKRVASGGHNIPQEVVRRRYERSRQNFVDLYLPIADRWIVYDNSKKIQKVAEKPLARAREIYQLQIWQQIING